MVNNITKEVYEELMNTQSKKLEETFNMNNIPTAMRSQSHTNDQITLKISETELKLIQYLIKEMPPVEGDVEFEEFENFIDLVIKVRTAQKGEF
tara:strand:+ start:889 stop:1170 length:282 start_codon:yes stop_codon:yes gene_type:complete